MTKFVKLLERARSCRRFKGKVGMKELEELIACARLSPSGRNQQVVRFGLIRNKEAVAKLAVCHRWASAIDWEGPTPKEYPGAYIALYLPKGALPLAVIDLGICAQTLNLAANAVGLKTCMIMSFKPEIVEEVVKTPEDMELRLLMAIGKPAEKQVVRKMDDSVDYWREGEMHCVPKMAVKNLIVARL